MKAYGWGGVGVEVRDLAIGQHTWGPNIQHWLAKWRLKANELKSYHTTFTLKRSTCPPVQLNGTYLPHTEDVKYLGVHLDRRLTWRKHISTKRRHLDIQLRKLYWIIGRKSQLSVGNKLFLYKSILKPIWTYGIQLWERRPPPTSKSLKDFMPKYSESLPMHRGTSQMQCYTATYVLLP